MSEKKGKSNQREKKDFTVISHAYSEALKSGYEEICKSYHAIDNSRIKTLSFLPLASLIGILGLNSESIFSLQTTESRQIISFIGIFAATFTLALFIFEIGGILRCNELILRGSDIEKKLNIKGQFSYTTNKSWWARLFEGVFNYISAACLTYSTVFSAWLFTTFRFGFNWSIYDCSFTALGAGLVFSIFVFILIRKIINEEKRMYFSSGSFSLREYYKNSD